MGPSHLNNTNHWRLLQFMISAFFFLCAGAAGNGQEIFLGVTYLCNGERLVIDGCNIRDTSDAGKCYIAHPDHVSAAGIAPYSYMTRGELKKLLATCKRPSAEEIARAKAFQKKLQDAQDAAEQKNNELMRGGSAAAKPLTPDQEEYRECLESGRDPARCSGQSRTKGITSMLGMLIPQAGDVTQDLHHPGLFLTGIYKGAGTLRLDFGEEGTRLVCKDFEAASHPYKVEMNGSRTVVRVEAEPHPILLAIMQDGTLMGPGEIDLKGQVVTGYGQARDLDPKTGQELYTSHSVPITEARVERCNIGALAGRSSGSQEDLGSALGFFEPSPTKDVPPGLRLYGEYGGAGGFGLKFYVDSALVRCGDVSVAHEYAIQQKDSELVVLLKDAARPLAFSYRADGTLLGSGPVQVNGRKMVGKQTNGDPAYASRSANCSMGVVSPIKEGSSTAASRAAANAFAPAAASSSSASGAGFATSPAPGGNAVLSISSGFHPEPGTFNPLAAHPYVLLRHSFAEVVSKTGVPLPAGVPAYKYFGMACTNKAPECRTILDAVKADTASVARADANGNGTLLGVPPGSYYLMISTRYKNQALVWGQLVQLKPGTNSLTLDPSNATLMN